MTDACTARQNYEQDTKSQTPIYPSLGAWKQKQGVHMVLADSSSRVLAP